MTSFTKFNQSILCESSSELSHASFKLLLFYIRQSVGKQNNDREMDFCVEQICNGLVIRGIKRTKGVGLSRRAFTTALKELETKGYIHIIVKGNRWRSNIVKLSYKLTKKTFHGKYTFHMIPHSFIDKYLSELSGTETKVLYQMISYQRSGTVEVSTIDIVKVTGVSKKSTQRALNTLSDKGFINIIEHGTSHTTHKIQFTDKWRNEAQQVSTKKDTGPKPVKLIKPKLEPLLISTIVKHTAPEPVGVGAALDKIMISEPLLCGYDKHTQLKHHVSNELNEYGIKRYKAEDFNEYIKYMIDKSDSPENLFSEAISYVIPKDTMIDLDRDWASIVDRIKKYSQYLINISTAIKQEQTQRIVEL
jgi:DNA-binding MarR family transcriptional regulator